VWRARPGDDTSFLGLCGAGIALSWAYGWAHRALLSKAHLHTALPDLLLRFTTAVQLLVLVPVIVGLAVWQWRSRRGPPAQPASAMAASPASPPGSDPLGPP
jgi:hypothetical protein